jgi:hypothetical protein
VPKSLHAWFYNYGLVFHCHILEIHWKQRQQCVSSSQFIQLISIYKKALHEYIIRQISYWMILSVYGPWFCLSYSDNDLVQFGFWNCLSGYSILLFHYASFVRNVFIGFFFTIIWQQAIHICINNYQIHYCIIDFHCSIMPCLWGMLFIG